MTSLVLKGDRDGVRVHVAHARSLVETLDALSHRVTGAQHFFQGACFYFDVAAGEVTPSHLGAIAAWVRAHPHVKLGGVRRVPPAPAGAAVQPAEGRAGGADAARTAVAVLVPGPLQSGQRVETGGHAVILGNINAGAEVLAGGSVFVWGSLQGTVRAGGRLGERAVVVAQELAPVQLSIGAVTAAAPWRGLPAGQVQRNAALEYARIEGRRLVIEPWEPAPGAPAPWLGPGGSAGGDSGEPGGGTEVGPRAG